VSGNGIRDLTNKKETLMERTDIQRILCWLAIVLSCLLPSCTKAPDPVNRLMAYLQVDSSMPLARDIGTIRSREVPYDTVTKKIALPELAERQKALITRKLRFFDSSSAIQNHSAYLYSARVLVEGLVTLAIYTESSYGSLMFLINFKDTSMTDYIHCDGDDEGSVAHEAMDREVIEGHSEWMEVHHDSIVIIAKTLDRIEFLDGRPTVEFPKDSTVSIYRIDHQGMFDRIFHDSTSFIEPGL
jgi:hypothetical protein